MLCQIRSSFSQWCVILAYQKHWVKHSLKQYYDCDKNNCRSVSTITSLFLIISCFSFFYLSGQITQEESLFYYDNGENVSTLSDPNHIPIFLDEIDNDTLNEAIDICGGDENIECLFDFSQTRNEALAQSTANTNNVNNENEQVIG